MFAYVYKPVTDELFTATKGGGAYKNGQPIHISNRPIERCWLELSAPFSLPSVAPMAAAIRAQINGFRVVGDFTLVAEGKIDAHLVYQTHGKAWDYAPRALLLAEADAKVRNVGSGSYDYRNFDLLAASPVVFDILMPIITESLKAEAKS